MGNVPVVSSDGNAFVDEGENGRDRALTFHWKAGDRGWLKALDLPSAGSKKRDEATPSILLEAVLAHASGQPAVSYSRRRAFYAGLTRYHGTSFTYDTVVPTVDALARLGLLHTWIAPGKGPCGTQSTFCATPLLLEAVPRDLVANAEHAVRELVRLRDAEKRLVAYRDTEETCRMRRHLEAHNEALASLQFSIEGEGIVADGPVIRFDERWLKEREGGGPREAVIYPAMKTLYRVFNCDLHSGGRLYGHSVQQIPKKAREMLLINGEPTVEPDHPEFHTRLLYMLIGRHMEGGAYDVLGWPREVAKRALNTIYNAMTPQGAAGAVAAKIREEMPGTEYGESYRMAWRLIADLKVRHAPIAEFFHRGVGLMLQNVDSKMAEAVLQRLRKKGIVVVPLHDSFRGPALPGPCAVRRRNP
jgi:hypothetical protein